MNPEIDAAMYPDLPMNWPAFGVPDLMVVDNGLDLTSAGVREACIALGIDLLFAPPRTPWYKGGLAADEPSPLPIVLTTTRSTSKSLVSNVARAGGDPLAGTRTQDDEELNLRDAAPRMEVHGFAFDELHNAFAAKPAAELARMAMTMKTLANSLSMPLIAMGINGLEDFLDAHPELRQRFERRVYLDDPQVNSPDELLDMQRLLAAMAAVAPCDDQCELSKPDILRRLLVAADCRFGSVINLVRSACAIGAMSKQSRMTLENFCSAYLEVAPRNRRNAEVNPFLMPKDSVKALLKQMQSRRDTARAAT